MTERDEAALLEAELDPEAAGAGGAAWGAGERFCPPPVLMGFGGGTAPPGFNSEGGESATGLDGLRSTEETPRFFPCNPRGS